MKWNHIDILGVEVNSITVIIMFIYVSCISLYGFWQGKHVKTAKSYTKIRLTKWQAATFLAGITLGGGSTYGLAGDSVKFGMTYIFWYPVSIFLGWFITGLIFAKPYFHLGGVTVPTLLSTRFGKKTQIASSIASLIYAYFTLTIEIYALAAIILSLIPTISLISAYIISLVINVSGVVFSGLEGSSKINFINAAVMLVAFTISVVVLWRIVGGWHNAINSVVELLPQVGGEGINASTWLSINGMGIGIAGQLILGKAGRLGGVSTTSNVAASCYSEREAKKAFFLGGIISGIPVALAGMLGVLTAAFSGNHLIDLPIYSALGYALQEISPVLSGFLLAAISAGIISTYGPIVLLFSNVIIEDLFVEKIKKEKKRFLYPIVILLGSLLGVLFLVFFGVDDLLPFLYKTAFPCTVPITLIVAIGMFSKSFTEKAACLAIYISIPAALIWTFVFEDPFGIPNIYIPYIITMIIYGINVVKNKCYKTRNGV